MTMSDLLQCEAWKALQAHYKDMSHVHMRDLFSQDTKRFERYSRLFAGDDILVDFSKNILNDETLELLMQLARERDVPGWIERMFKAKRSTTPNTVPCCIPHCATVPTIL